MKKSVIATHSWEKLFLHLVAGMERRIIMMLMIMMCPVEAWKNEKNIIFKKTSEVVITRSKWLITMVVDLAPYRILLDRLKSEIIALRRARNQVAENYVHQEGYIKLLYSLEQESRVMESQWKEMNLYLRGIGLLQSGPGGGGSYGRKGPECIIWYSVWRRCKGYPEEVVGCRKESENNSSGG